MECRLKTLASHRSRADLHEIDLEGFEYEVIAGGPGDAETVRAGGG